MAIRSLLRTAVIKGSATGATAPIYVDSDDNIVKVIPAGSGTTEVEIVDASSTQTLTNKTLTSPVFSKSYTRQVAGPGKVGSAAGWTLAGADNLPYIATMAASQTAGTLVIRLGGLQIGATITGFKIVAQVESAGGTVTIDAAVRAVTNVAAEPTDAAITGTFTQVSVTADTAVAQASGAMTEVVTSGKSYYLLITATTAGSTDIILQHPEITTTEI